MVAVRLPTSTVALLLKYTPFGLLMNTWPLPVILPKIWLALLSSTRLSTAELLFGSTKFTCAALPRLKVFQSMTARWLVWSTLSTAVVGVLLVVIVAEPPTTVPPVGN